MDSGQDSVNKLSINAAWTNKQRKMVQIHLFSLGWLINMRINIPLFHHQSTLAQVVTDSPVLGSV